MTPQPQKPSVCIYRDRLLPASETFIAAQGSALTRYRPLFAGCRRVTSGLAAPGPQYTIGDTRISVGELAFKSFGVPPRRWIDAIVAEQPSILHAHFGTDGVFAVPLARALGVPLVVTFHGFDATVRPGLNPLMREYRRRLPALFGNARRIIAVSHFIRQRVIELGCPEELVTTHYTGVDLSGFAVRPQTVDRTVVLFVGRLVEKKGCADLIDAMAMTGLRRELVIVGDGPERVALEKRARTQRVAVTFAGAQPPNVVRDWMARAEVFCAPSKQASSGDSEGFGMVFIEAQAMGVPVVSTRHGGIPEAVEEGRTAVLVDEGDRTQLAEALNTLLTDGELRARMAAAGRALVESRFDLHRQTARLEQIYDLVRR